MTRCVFEFRLSPSGVLQIMHVERINMRSLSHDETVQVGGGFKPSFQILSGNLNLRGEVLPDRPRLMPQPLHRVPCSGLLGRIGVFGRLFTANWAIRHRPELF